MKKYLKYLSFLVITLIFSINKVYAQTPQEVTFNDITTIANLTFNKTIEYSENTITITQTDTNKARLCLNLICEEKTLTYNIKDQYNHYRYTYQVWKRTTGEYLIIFDYIEFYNDWSWGSSGEEKAFYWGYMTSSNNTTIGDNYIESAESLRYTKTCKVRDNGTCASNYYYNNSWNQYIYRNNEWENTDNWYPEGSNWKLIESNASTLVCQTGSCNSINNQSDFTGYKIYDFEETPTPSYVEKNDISFSQEIKSIDLYYTLPQNDSYKIIFKSRLNNNTQASMTPTNYKFYGRKCNNQTCYWEEVNTNVSVSNTNYTYDSENKELEVTFDLNIGITSYNKIKLAIETGIQGPWGAKIYNLQDSDFMLDINTVNSSYSIEPYTETVGTKKAILIDTKNNDINYRFYIKRELDYGNVVFYQYSKQQNMIENELASNNFRVGEFRSSNLIYGSSNLQGEYIIQTSTQELNSNKGLYMLMTGIRNIEIFYIYMGTQVYYTWSNSLTFNVDYNGTQTTTTLGTTNSFLNNYYSDNNVDKVDFTGIKEIVEEYKEYKNDWLTLFNSFYDPLPQIIKNIMILLYFSMLAYGIFLIYKD